jgi:hypothetical protein
MPPVPPKEQVLYEFLVVGSLSMLEESNDIVVKIVVVEFTVYDLPTATVR